MFSVPLNFNFRHIPAIEPNSIINIYKNEKLYWRGFINQITLDMYNNKKVHCVEDIAWLKYSVTQKTLRSSSSGGDNKKKCINTIMNEFYTLLNAYPNLKQQISIGNIAGESDLYDFYIPRYTNIYGAIHTVVGNGCFIFMRSSGRLTRIMDICKLEDLGTSNQVIKLGENLMDYAQVIDTTDIINYLRIVGYIIDNGGNKELTFFKTYSDPESINLYGLRSGYTEIEFMKNDTQFSKEALAYFNSVKSPKYIFDITALDLSTLGNDVDDINLGDSVKIECPSFGIDDRYRITELTQYIQEPEKNTYTLSSGLNLQPSLTEMVGKG